MVHQNKRSTSFVIFIIVEDKKIYGISGELQDGVERKDTDSIDFELDICHTCNEAYEETGILPDECDEHYCADSFIGYRIEKDVPNLYAGFFFTASAAEGHLASNRHHYNSTAKTYGISAYHNNELKSVMMHLVGEENYNSLK